MLWAVTSEAAYPTGWSDRGAPTSARTGAIPSAVVDTAANDWCGSINCPSTPMGLRFVARLYAVARHECRHASLFFRTSPRLLPHATHGLGPTGFGLVEAKPAKGDDARESSSISLMHEARLADPSPDQAGISQTHL